MSQRKDLAVKKFLEKPENFSDLFNGSIFCGRQVLRADMLERLPGESALSFPDKEGQKVSERRYRDAICKASGSTTYAVFAVEGQEKTHYAMPVREMLYDALNYAGQIKELTDRHRREKDYNNSAEFLSGLLAEDRLAPVVTICFYYGTGKWEGPLDLFDMLDIPEEYEDMKPFMTNYKVNLVQASNVAPDNFRTDLRHVFSLLGMAADGAGMKRYIQERPEEFRHISYETFDCLRELLHVDKWWKTDGFERKGEVDMCKALEEIAEMAKDEGKAEGVRVGIKALAEICEKLGVPFEQTVEMVTEKFGMSSEDARESVELYWK